MTKSYTGVAVILHWLIAVMLVSMVFYGWYMEDLRHALFDGTQGVSIEAVREAYNLHKTFGLLVLGLSVARLAWRLTHPQPPLPEGMKPWEKTVAVSVHWAFYAIMIGMPILGWISASASEQPSLLMNNPDLQIPRLGIPVNHDLHEITGEVHGKGGWAILVLMGLHVAAALKHQFLDRDGLLGRMIPFLK